MSHELHAAVLEAAKQNEVAVGVSGRQDGDGGGLRRVSFSERLEGETLPPALYSADWRIPFTVCQQSRVFWLFCK